MVFALGLIAVAGILLWSRSAAATEGIPSPEDRLTTEVPCRAITRGKAHWFSYYDKQQFDVTGRYVLGMEVDFEDRTPNADDTVTLGYIDLENGDAWTPFAETRAWCWQQGCMLQWLPGSTTEVIYNDRDGDHYVSVIQDVFTGQKRTLPLPVYTVSPDGAYAMSVNFARIDETRPGYGYKGVVDPYADQLMPRDDGIRRLDLKTGESTMAVSLGGIAELPNENPADGKHWFNHLLINTDGTRFEFLHRFYAQPVTEGSWKTRMFTANPDGTGLHCVNGHGHVSHFIWRDPDHIMTWSREPEEDEPHYHVYTDRRDGYETVGAGVLTQDGHMTYSPDAQWVLTDTYPDPHTRMQRLMLYRPADGRLLTLGTFYSPPAAAGEIRCDLHPRWNRDGTMVTVDSMCDGEHRQIYLLEVGELLARQ